MAEISTAARKPGQTLGKTGGAKPTSGQPSWAIKALPLALAGLLPNAFADIVVAPNEQTTISQSANGVPVIEIANPNNQGLSHNRFTEFNVNQPGAIFNNSMRDGVSQIGAQVQRNLGLTREARAILSEVTGNGPSNLAGTLEVFGGRADLLIANPNLKREATGILAEVTGNSPSTVAGTLEVFGGRADILIAKVDKTLTNGGDVSSAGTLSLSAKDMRSTKGSKLQSVVKTTITVANDLVNETGSVMVTRGDFTMRSGGKMDTGANINVGGQNAQILADGALTNAAGSIITSKNLEMKSGVNLTSENGALINAVGQLKLESVGDMINNENAIIDAAHIIAKVGGTLRNTASSILSGETVSIDAKSIVNKGNSRIGGTDALTLVTSENISNEDGSQLTSKKVLTAKAGGTLSNDNSSINAPTLSLNGTTVTNSNKGEMVGKTVGITASDSFTTQTDAMVNGDYLTLDANYVKGSNSSVLARETLDITTRDLQSTAIMHSLNTATLSSKGGTDLLIVKGSIVPTADKLLTINTNNLTVDGSLKSASELVINTTGNVRNNGEIIGGSNLTINATGAIDNLANKLIYASKNLTLNAGTTLTNGKNALIRAYNDLRLKAKTAVVNNVGRIDAGGDVAIDTPRLENVSEATGDVSVKVIGSDRGYIHTDNWYSEAWPPTNTQYFHTEFWLPRYTADGLVVQQATIKAGRDLRLNQADYRNTSASVRNVGGLMAAVGNIQVDGNLTNVGVAKSIPVVDYLKVVSIYARWTVSESTVSDGPELHANLYDLLDKNLLVPTYVVTPEDRKKYPYMTDDQIRMFVAPPIPGQVISGGTQWDNSLKKTSSPELNAVFSAVLGADWKSLNHDTLVARWAAFKAAPSATLDFYANKQAELSAGGDFVHTGGSLTNGTSANWGKNRTVDVQIGDEKVVTVQGDLDALFNRDSAFDFSKDTNIKALQDAINAAKIQQELMSENPLFSPNPPPLDLTGEVVDPTKIPTGNLNGADFKGVYPLYVSRVSFDPKLFLGSEYLFKKIGYNPGKTVSVLGDAYFDNELIVRTIENTVGNFFAVNRQLSGTTLVQNLMDNAATQVGKLGLVMGQPLTAAQYEKLDSDMVWYEPQVVNGLTVLAPKVYVSKNTLLARQKDQKNGGVITAKNVLIDATSVNNINGVIRGTNDTLIYAKTDINNVSQGGTDTGIYGGDKGRLVMTAEGSITNQGGNTSGLQQTIAAGKDVTNSATTGYAADGSLYVREDGVMGAGTTQAGTERKSDELASNAKKAQDAAAAAANQALADVAPSTTTPALATTLAAVEGTPADGQDTQPAQPPKPKTSERTAFETALAQHKAGALGKGTESSLTVTSGGNVDLTGSRAAADTVTLNAKGDVNLDDIHEVGSSFKSETTRGTLSSKQVTETTGWAASKGNEVDANHLSITAGGNLNMTGGALNTQTSTVKVAGDMTVAAAKDLAMRELETKTAGFVAGASVGAGGYEAGVAYDTNAGGSTFAGKGAASQSLANNGSSGQRALNNANAGRGSTTGANFRVGYEQVTTTETSKAKTHTNAQLNLGTGEVDVGGTFDFGGADINKKSQVSAADRNALAAGKTPSFNTELPTLAIKAGDIKTTKFVDTASNTLKRETIFAGLSGEAHSNVVDVATNIANRAQKAADGMKPVGGDDLGDDALNGTLIAVEAIGNATQLAMGEVGGASVSLGAKITKEEAEAKKTQQNINLVGGNISMTTTKGDIDLNGVKIAGAKVTLDSAGAINQTAAVATSWDKAKTDIFTAGVSASVGVTAAGQGGVGLSVEASGVHDRTETSSKTHTNGLIAGTDVTIKTKGDHTMTGANIVGNAVNIDVGGKQTITSVQDISKMDHERGTWGFSAGVAWDLAQLAAGNVIPKPTFSVSGSGGKDYDNSAITKKQAGIDAGVLNLAVAGDQSLTGAHIINRSGEGSFNVGGETIATSLTDTRDKDGGYGGGSAGINRNGIAQVIVQGGRVDQVRYEAENSATIDLNGGKATLGKGVKGTLNNDDAKLVNVKKDYTIQGSDIKVEISPDSFKRGKGKGGDDPEAPGPGNDVIDAPQRPTITKPTTRTIEDGPTITRPSGGTPDAPAQRPATPPADYDGPRTDTTRPSEPPADYPGSRPGTPSTSRPSEPAPDYPGSRPGTPSNSRPSEPAADYPGSRPGTPSTSRPSDPPADYPDSRPDTPSTSRPSDPPVDYPDAGGIDTPNRTTVTGPRADADADGTKPSKPATTEVAEGPTTTKPSTSTDGDAPDAPVVTRRPKPNEEILEASDETAPTSLRNVLERFNADTSTQDALKKNPVVMVVVNPDGTKSKLTLSSNAELEALNGRQIIFRKTAAAGPNDSPLYIQVNKYPEGKYGFEYKSAASKINPIQPGNGMDDVPKRATDPDAPAVVNPPRFSNITTEVDAPPTPPKPTQPRTSSGAPDGGSTQETRF